MCVFCSPLFLWNNSKVERLFSLRCLSAAKKVIRAKHCHLKAKRDVICMMQRSHPSSVKLSSYPFQKLICLISIKKQCSFLLLFDGTNLSTLLACSVCVYSVCVVDFDWPSESSNSLDSNNGILPCIVEKMNGNSTRDPCGTLVWDAAQWGFSCEASLLRSHVTL